jgi:hypothetical protein
MPLSQRFLSQEQRTALVVEQAANMNSMLSILSADTSFALKTTKTLSLLPLSKNAKAEFPFSAET